MFRKLLFFSNKKCRYENKIHLNRIIHTWTENQILISILHKLQIFKFKTKLFLFISSYFLQKFNIILACEYAKLWKRIVLSSVLSVEVVTSSLIQT